MRPTRHGMAAVLLGAVAAGAGAVRAGTVRAGEEAKDRLVVHEWGTFTSVQGADGVGLEGLHHEEEALPGFVYDRRMLRDCPLRAQGWKGLELPANHVTQKMETPVLYFHTRTPRQVRVRVDFVDGLISQWYPVVDKVGPPEGAPDAGPLDLRTVKRSFVEWDVDLLPRTGPAPAELPPSSAETRTWDLARNVDAAWVRTRPRQGPERAGPVEAEHFLFYRGLGTFTLPMTAEFDPEGRLTFTNGSAHQVAQVVALEVEAGGTRGRHDIECYVAPGQRRGSGKTGRGLLDGREFEAWGPGGSPGLRGDLRKILVGQGLAVDEATAMVETWSHSWFAQDGLRLLYVVPRPLVDELLPLVIDPKPDRVVRVLLGRIECLPPARVAAMEAALAELAATSAAPTADAARAGAAADRARALGGRFLEPLLRRVVAVTQDEGARRAAQGWLDKLATEAAAPHRGAR